MISESDLISAVLCTARARALHHCVSIGPCTPYPSMKLSVNGEPRREVEIMRRMKHPNIVNLLDVVFEDDLLVVSTSTGQRAAPRMQACVKAFVCAVCRW